MPQVAPGRDKVDLGDEVRVDEPFGASGARAMAGR